MRLPANPGVVRSPARGRSTAFATGDATWRCPSRAGRVVAATHGASRKRRGDSPATLAWVACRLAAGVDDVRRDVAVPALRDNLSAGTGGGVLWNCWWFAPVARPCGIREAAAPHWLGRHLP